MNLLITLETRWFFPGTIPPEVEKWFSSLGKALAPPPRTDLYLLGTGEALGVKLREGRIELKKRTAQYGKKEFSPGVSGELEGWVKWGFEAESPAFAALQADQHWVAVEKTRQIIYYSLDAGGEVVLSSPGSLPETGGGLELTALRLAGQDWWTVGVEVFGAAESLQDYLYKIVMRGMSGISKISFNSVDSYSYPYWIETNTRDID